MTTQFATVEPVRMRPTPAELAIIDTMIADGHTGPCPVMFNAGPRLGWVECILHIGHDEMCVCL